MKYVILVILLITVSMGQVPQTTFSTEADTYITPDGGPMVNHGSETELLISLAPPREALLYADVSTGLNLFDLNSEDLFQTIVSGSLQLSINSVVCSSAVTEITLSIQSVASFDEAAATWVSRDRSAGELVGQVTLSAGDTGVKEVDITSALKRNAPLKSYRIVAGAGSGECVVSLASRESSGSSVSVVNPVISDDLYDVQTISVTGVMNGQNTSGLMGYIEDGDADADVQILLMHGVGSNPNMYRGVVALLAPHARVIAVSPIGLGESDKPTVVGAFASDFRVGVHASFLTAFRQELGLDNAILVLHDQGGYVGLASWLQEPEGIAAIWNHESWLNVCPPEEHGIVCFNNTVIGPENTGTFMGFQAPGFGEVLIYINNFLGAGLYQGLSFRNVPQEILTVFDSDKYGPTYCEEERGGNNGCEINAQLSLMYFTNQTDFGMYLSLPNKRAALLGFPRYAPPPGRPDDQPGSPDLSREQDVLFEYTAALKESSIPIGVGVQQSIPGWYNALVRSQGMVDYARSAYGASVSSLGLGLHFLAEDLQANIAMRILEFGRDTQLIA